MDFKAKYLLDDDAYNRYIFQKKLEEKRKLKEEWMINMSKIEGINKCNEGDEKNSPPLPPADMIDWTGTGNSWIGIFNYNEIFFRIYKDELYNDNYKWVSRCSNIECHKNRFTNNFKCYNKN